MSGPAPQWICPDVASARTWRRPGRGVGPDVASAGMGRRAGGVRAVAWVARGGGAREGPGRQVAGDRRTAPRRVSEGRRDGRTWGYLLPVAAARRRERASMLAASSRIRPVAMNLTPAL